MSQPPAQDCKPYSCEVQVTEDTEALRASCRALAALYVRGLLAGTVLCVLLSELAVRTRLVRGANPFNHVCFKCTALGANCEIRVRFKKAPDSNINKSAAACAHEHWNANQGPTSDRLSFYQPVKLKPISVIQGAAVHSHELLSAALAALLGGHDHNPRS